MLTDDFILRKDARCTPFQQPAFFALHTVSRAGMPAALNFANTLPEKNFLLFFSNMAHNNTRDFSSR